MFSPLAFVRRACTQNVSYNEEGKDLNENLKKLVEMIKEKKHIVILSGAGISKQSGLNVYRGPNGIYTKIKNGEKFDNFKGIYFPSRLHMQLAKLVEVGIVEFVITANCDNLHGMSGISREKLVELHGNMFVAKCLECKNEFEMNQIIAQPNFRLAIAEPPLKKRKIKDELKSGLSKIDRKVEGICPLCKTETLQHTIINYGEEIPEDKWNLAYEAADSSDLMIIIGSSLSVLPINELPYQSEDYVIVNKDPTPCDDEASITFHNELAENVFEGVMKSLDLDVPSYHLVIPLKFKVTKEFVNDEIFYEVDLTNDLYVQSLIRSIAIESKQKSRKKNKKKPEDAPNRLLKRNAFCKSFRMTLKKPVSLEIRFHSVPQLTNISRTPFTFETTWKQGLNNYVLSCFVHDNPLKMTIHEHSEFLKEFPNATIPEESVLKTGETSS